MLSQKIRALAEQQSDAAACYYKGESITYKELLDRIDHRIDRFSRGIGRVIGLIYNHPVEFIINCVAADELGFSILMLENDSPEMRKKIVQHFSASQLIRDNEIILLTDRSGKHGDRDAQQSEVILFTSGTTGEPKAANHTWETLSTPVRFSKRFQSIVWFSAYPLRFYAGLQVMLQALLNGSAIALTDTYAPDDISNLLIEAKVTHAAGTPTFWRNQMIFSDRRLLQKASLQQISLGGELVDQQVLDELHKIFPGARIVHIYASTELGRLFTVVDGLAGFPVSYLTIPPESGTELQITDGQLYARSSKSMRRYDSSGHSFFKDDWFATGDMVRINGDRVVFEGRKSDVINVGGAKVFPSHIEDHLRNIEGVADIRVYGKESSLVGEIVAADILPEKNTDAKELKKRINRFCNENLARHQIPRIIQIVDSIYVGDSLKKIRRKE